MAGIELTTREAILDFIHTRVWEGIHGFETIREQVIQCSEEIEIWIEEEISRHFMEKRMIEGTWPSYTDCDRLEGVFRDLTAMNILSLHAPACDLTGSYGAIREAWVADGAEHSTKIGYAVYSTKCVRSAIGSCSFTLAYGIIPVAPRVHEQGIKTVDIGNIIVDIMKSHGLSAALGTPQSHQITISPFCWQRRSPRLRN